MAQIWISLAIFFMVYAIFVTDTFNRSLSAWLGAVLMVFFGIIQVDDIFISTIDWHTITLLISMMILVGTMQRTSIFPYLAIRILRVVKAKPLYVFVLLTLITGLYAAFLDNIIAVMIIVPLTFSLTKLMKVNPMPFVIGEMMAANLGGTLTLTGSIPNLVIGGANKQLTYLSFVSYLGPILLLITFAVILILVRIYRKELLVEVTNWTALDEIDVSLPAKQSTIIRNQFIVFGLTLIGFFLHSFLQLDIATIAISGALLMIMFGTKKVDMEQSLSLIQWETVLLVTGVFAIVGGLQHLGIFRALAEQALTFTDGHLVLTASALLWVSGILSGTVDNLIYVISMVPIIQEYHQGLVQTGNDPQTNIMWWSLSLGAGIGGIATWVASPVNLIVLGMVLKQKQKMNYREFLKIGLPIAFGCLMLAQLYLLFRYYIG